jgi:hypothetical protein
VSNYFNGMQNYSQNCVLMGDQSYPQHAPVLRGACGSRATKSSDAARLKALFALCLLPASITTLQARPATTLGFILGI